MNERIMKAYIQPQMQVTQFTSLNLMETEGVSVGGKGDQSQFLAPQRSDKEVF